MQRSDLEHLIRACGEIANDDEIIIVGSQSILGQFPNAPLRLLVSMEADVYPANKPDLADKVDGAIGEGSSFHELHGYYAQGVGPKTAILPTDWKKRLVPIRNENTGGTTGQCLEIHDLVVSKLVVGRTKDLVFAQEIAKARMIVGSILLKRIAGTTLSRPQRGIVEARARSLPTTESTA